MDEFDIPIDIITNKLLDWLISRRHVKKEWPTHIIKVREKINNAIQDMPAHDGIVKLLSGQHINYFHCLQIVDILKETEADTKNLFGRYGSQRMKDWQDIITNYQKDNLYLGEAAQILMRNVNYEVPSLKKQVSKGEQAQLDCEKKMKDYSRAEHRALNEFNLTCKQLGIVGTKIRCELVELLQELPSIYKKVVENVKNLQAAFNYYKAFVDYHSGKEKNAIVLPMLAYLLAHGNTTTYEYTYGEKPVSIEEPSLNIGEESESKVDVVENIDFGDDVQIDFGDVEPEKDVDTGNTPISEGSIDWGTIATDEEFEIVDLDVNLEESGIVVEKSGLDGGVARGTDAYTILDNPKTRDQILNDLLELQSFLKMRIFEMSTDNLDFLTLFDASATLQKETTASVTRYSDFVAISLNDLTNKRILHLHNMKHSPRYVDLLTASLKQKLIVVERMQMNQKLIEEKVKQLKQEIRKTMPMIKRIIEKTKVLQHDIEKDISKKYKGRVVNIIGGVNMM